MGDKRLVRLANAQPDDVRLLHPEARLSGRRCRLPTQPTGSAAGDRHQWPGSRTSTAHSCCDCSTKDSANRRRPAGFGTRRSAGSGVPFLNGGLFDVHDLERDYPGIERFPDAAFERVFEFFDGYRWHLDERPSPRGQRDQPRCARLHLREVHQSEADLGAYYTKEDITGYISRNTVIPFLFDEAKKGCPVAFEPDGGVWGLLRDDPDRYIYPAVAHGLTWDARNLSCAEADRSASALFPTR